MQWNVPTAEGIAAAIRVMKLTATQAMADITTALSQTNTITTPGTADSSAAKRMEEGILNGLAVLRKVVRGSVEVCMDAVHDTQDKTGDFSAMSSLERARVRLTEALSVEDKAFLLHFRTEVLKFLSSFHSAISQPAMVSLGNSPSVRVMCMKILHIVVNVRMSWMKNVDNLQKYYKMEKNMSRSAIVQYLQKAIKRCPSISNGKYTGPIATNTPASMYDPEVWYGHDISVHNISDRVSIQLAIRNKELSFAATRAVTKGP